MVDTGGPKPIRIGDQVLVTADGASWPARVVAIGTWSYMVAVDTLGRLWMEVVMSMSAVSWTRLVELSPTLDQADGAAFDALAAAIAWQPRRADVADVIGAIRLLSPPAGIERASTVTSATAVPK